MSPTSRRIAGAVVSACALLALGSGVASATVSPGEPTNPPAASPVPTVAAPRPAEPSAVPARGAEATPAQTVSPPTAAPTEPRSATATPVPATPVPPRSATAVPVPATAAPVPAPEELAHTGGDNMTVVYAVAGGALLLLGAGGVFATGRMRGRSTD